MQEKNQRMRGHKLFTKEVLKRIPPLYSQEKVSDPIVQASFFSPYSQARWLVLEANTDQKLMFGYCEVLSGCGELGYISMEELEGATVRGIPAVERDCSFRPRPLSQVKKDLGL